MKLGTISYKEKIYNLDYMNAQEIEDLLKEITQSRKSKFEEMKKLLNEQ